MKEFELTYENFADCVDAATGKPIPKEGNVVIPEKVIYHGEEYPVKAIGNSAFYNSDHLTAVHIPNGVTKIDIGAFRDCSNLKSVNIPNSVVSIGDNAFEHCKRLKTIHIPDSVTNIGYNVFWGCDNLSSIIVDQKNPVYDSRENSNALIETASNTLIRGCKNSVIPAGVTTIEYFAFDGCHGLKFIEIPDSVTTIKNTAFKNCSGDLLINYKGTLITYKAFSQTKKLFNPTRKLYNDLPDKVCFDIAKNIADILGNNIYSPVLATIFSNAESNGVLTDTVNQIKKDFQTIGFYDIKNSADVKAKEQLTSMFRADKRSRGVVPKIIDALVIASTELHIPPEDIVKSFENKKFRDAVTAMRSCNKRNRFCDVEAVLFAMNFDINTVKNVILENQNKDYASVLLCESYKKNDGHLLDLSKWVASHPDVSQDLVREIVKYKDKLAIDAFGNVDTIRTQILKIRMSMEIQEIEKSYPEFKFASCKCNLPKTEVELGDYKAYIMDAQDPRQVLFGYNADCYRNYVIEESSMMYGLANPNAGFFVIENKKSGKFVAQAIPWETEDGKTLFLDNANFGKIGKLNKFAPILGKWCAESPYSNILMGTGYFKIASDKIRLSESITLPMTDEIHVFLKKWDPIDNMDFGIPYTSADKFCYYLKSDDFVEPYFKDAYLSLGRDTKGFDRHTPILGSVIQKGFSRLSFPKRTAQRKSM